jgi:hypothetical protein
LADAILLERRGVPAVSVCTDKFRLTAEAMARLHGFEGYRFITVAHPIASLELPELAHLAAGALDDVLAILEVSG